MPLVRAGDPAIPKNHAKRTDPLGGCFEPRIHAPPGSNQGIVDAKVSRDSTQW